MNVDGIGAWTKGVHRREESKVFTRICLVPWDSGKNIKRGHKRSATELRMILGIELGGEAGEVKIFS